MVGGVDAANSASIHFHKGFGFVETGRLKQVGWKFDRWLDLVFMQKTAGLTGGLCYWPEAACPRMIVPSPSDRLAAALILDPHRLPRRPRQRRAPRGLECRRPHAAGPGPCCRLGGILSGVVATPFAFVWGLPPAAAWKWVALGMVFNMLTMRALMATYRRAALRDRLSHGARHRASGRRAHRLEPVRGEADALRHGGNRRDLARGADAGRIGAARREGRSRRASGLRCSPVSRMPAS